MTARLLAAHWNAGDIAALISGRGPDGRPLPAKAWMALRRLGWAIDSPNEAKVNDRVRRMAQEQVGRILRAATWRVSLTAGIVSTWPKEPGRRTGEEWDAVRAAIPGGGHVLSSVIKARTRQVDRFLAANGRMPLDVFELEPPPHAAAMLLLAACDKQEAVIDRHGADPRRALLRVQLPVRPDPRSNKDWSWVAIPLALPPTVPAGAQLHLPEVRIVGGKARADLPFTHAVPAARPDGHTIAAGVDWGLNTLLSVGAVRLNGDGTITTLGAGAQYRASGVLAKAHRLRRQDECLRARHQRYERLIAGDAAHPLTQKAAVITREHQWVSRKRSGLNDALARSAARWAVDQAIADGASVLYVEDLRTLEARGMGRRMNVHLSQAVRGAIVERMRHLAAEVGITVVTVPARDTSRCCPRCLAPLRHCKSPDQPRAPGWKWARCPACGWQGDRDQGASQRVGARGLTHQANTTRRRDTGEMTIHTIDAIAEAAAVITPTAPGRDRSKTGPTRRQVSRRAPGRRVAPSPPPCGGGKRPEGHATTARIVLPRAADRRDQGVTTNGTTPVRRPHRARGAALGAGFHLNAHATPPRWVVVGCCPAGAGQQTTTKPIRDADLSCEP